MTPGSSKMTLFNKRDSEHALSIRYDGAGENNGTEMDPLVTDSMS